MQNSYLSKKTNVLEGFYNLYIQTIFVIVCTVKTVRLHGAGYLNIGRTESYRSFRMPFPVSLL
jgi:hypothetical protein